MEARARAHGPWSLEEELGVLRVLESWGSLESGIRGLLSLGPW